MQTVLNQLNTLPGIVGSMVYDPEGRVLAQAFPTLFDADTLASAAGILLNGTSGLEVASGSISMLDFRFRDSRIVVRPLTGATLLMLCTTQANLQFLNISVGMAIPKIEKLAALPKPVTPSQRVPDKKASTNEELEENAEKLQGFEKVFLKMDSWMRKKSGE